MVDEEKPRCMSAAECNEARWKREKSAQAPMKSDDPEGYMWGMLVCAEIVSAKIMDLQVGSFRGQDVLDESLQ